MNKSRKSKKHSLFFILADCLLIHIVISVNPMKLQPSEALTPAQTDRGLKLVVKDGLAAEAMTTLTSGTFLVALSLKSGATNLQIGLLAALPILTNIFQLLANWLVQKYNNRRASA